LFDDRITTRLGAIVAFLLVIAMVLILRKDDTFAGKTISLRVYMNHPGALRAKADVQLGGRVVGDVQSIRLVTSNEARKSGHLLYPTGGVLVQIRVRSKYLSWICSNSEFFVNTKGLIGEAYLEIAPPPASEEMLPPVKNNDAIRGIDPARMEHIIVTSFLNARRFGALLEELEPSMYILRVEMRELFKTLNELEGQQESYGSFPDKLAQVSDNFAKVRAQFDEGGPSLAQLYSQAQALGRAANGQLQVLALQADSLPAHLVRIRNTIPGAMSEKFARAIRSAESSLVTFRKTMSDVQTLFAKVEAGMGTIGALLNDEEFVDDRKKLGRYIKRHPWEFLLRPLD